MCVYSPYLYKYMYVYMSISMHIDIHTYAFFLYTQTHRGLRIYKHTEAYIYTHI